MGAGAHDGVEEFKEEVSPVEDHDVFGLKGMEVPEGGGASESPRAQSAPHPNDNDCRRS